jgi:hypothetical protein
VQQRGDRGHRRDHQERHERQEQARAQGLAAPGVSAGERQREVGGGREEHDAPQAAGVVRSGSRNEREDDERRDAEEAGDPLGRGQDLEQIGCRQAHDAAHPEEQPD